MKQTLFTITNPFTATARNLIAGSLLCSLILMSQQTTGLADEPKKSLDDKLLEKLAPTNLPDAEKKPSPNQPDELDRTVQSMRKVGEQLAKKEVSDDTVKLQKSIIDDIDALIEKLKQPPPPKPKDQDQNQDQQNSDQNQKQNQQQQRNQQQQKQNKEGESQQQQQQSGKGDGSANGRQQQPSKSSESTDKELQRKQDERAAEMARRRALINEVWGHLPPNVREKLLNVGSEKLLPQYEDLIRKYYESLAEPTDGDLKPARSPK